MGATGAMIDPHVENNAHISHTWHYMVAADNKEKTSDLCAAGCGRILSSKHMIWLLTVDRPHRNELADCF
ncbi:MAG: hypothetical protein ACKPKO_32530, partial [Candidatus Fonsibacter sp.]